jgi:hypothetical protein
LYSCGYFIGIFISGAKFKIIGVTYLPRFDGSGPIIKVALLEEL